MRLQDPVVDLLPPPLVVLDRVAHDLPPPLLVVAVHLAREGIEVVMSDSHGEHVCTELAKGRVDGMLMNRPGVYDAPMWMHVLDALGGSACWAHNGERVDFRDSWYDEDTRTLRLSGVVACARDERQLTRLVAVAERCMLEENGG